MYSDQGEDLHGLPEAHGVEKEAPSRHAVRGSAAQARNSICCDSARLRRARERPALTYAAALSHDKA